MFKVLVVDDEEEIVDLIETLLEIEIEVEVTKAFDGEQGIKELSKETQFDLIISDVNMPGQGGREVFSVNLQSKNLPFVIMTGSDELEREFLETFHNANAYNRVLPKPWNPQEFSSIVQEILKNRVVA